MESLADLQTHFLSHEKSQNLDKLRTDFYCLWVLNFLKML